MSSSTKEALGAALKKMMAMPLIENKTLMKMTDRESRHNIRELLDFNE